MPWQSWVLLVGVAVVAPICRLLFGVIALRGVPERQRVEAIRANGDAWQGWHLWPRRREQ